MASVVNMNIRSIAKKFLSIRCYNNIRSISTSDKKKDGAAITPTAVSKDIPDFTKPHTQNWVSYGFDNHSEKDDLNMMHSIFFVSVTLCIMFGGMFLAYFPDFKARDWGSREAYLELRRREQAGLPLVDKNYIEPSLVKLPSDEELGDTEIII